MRGFFKHQTPHFKLRVWGSDPNVALEFDVVMDTGFDGFLMMPSAVAPQVGLVARSTTDVTFADGTSQPRLVAQGSAGLGTRTMTGLVILEDGTNEVLAGMAFIIAFGLMFAVTGADVLLVDYAQGDQAPSTVQIALPSPEV